MKAKELIKKIEMIQDVYGNDIEFGIGGKGNLSYLHNGKEYQVEDFDIDKYVKDLLASRKTIIEKYNRIEKRLADLKAMGYNIIG